MIRFDAGLLVQVDRAATGRGVSRSAWVPSLSTKALDDEGVDLLCTNRRAPVAHIKAFAAFKP
jgi:hypothetical protein